MLAGLRDYAQDERYRNVVVPYAGRIRLVVAAFFITADSHPEPVTVIGAE